MVGCGGLFFDPPKPEPSGIPKPYNERNPPVHRRQTYHNPTLRSISYKAQNPSAITFRDVVILFFAIYALGWQGYLALQKCYALGFVYPAERICEGGLSVAGCVWRSGWILVVDILGREWAATVLPWGFVAGLVVFVGEEVLGRFAGARG